MKKYKAAFYLNITIVILTIFALVMMFTGFKIMHGAKPLLESSSIGMFRFFTVDSNLLMGVSAIIMAIYEYKFLHNKIDIIPKKIYLLKYMGTVGVMLTFFVVFTYLVPIAGGGIFLMIMNSNLFFHLIIPILSMIVFIFFEKNNVINFKDTFYGLIPTIIYASFYLINILAHLENGVVSPKYDWYYFVQNGIWTASIVIPVMLLITYGISVLLWKFNRIKNDK